MATNKQQFNKKLLFQFLLNLAEPMKNGEGNAVCGIFVIHRELLAKNLAYLSVVCSVSLKNSKTGQVEVCI